MPDAAQELSSEFHFVPHPNICYNSTMTRTAVRTVVLSSAADFFNGMATAWAFAAYDSIFRHSWVDLLSSLLLAILSLSASMSIKLKFAYDKRT